MAKEETAIGSSLISTLNRNNAMNGHMGMAASTEARTTYLWLLSSYRKLTLFQQSPIANSSLARRGVLVAPPTP